ncbi:hypothetical protein GIB67_003064 [Kingdonia uniflora]|uniref:Uncharacterized protein n=1 Tax=Kingdonia uniflora TaxID=39325 RepID=A0A7J7N6J7_9MAGN|nr:hypothetical protein GIB67_003064 [Kingdonia uniflora]
MLLFRLLICRLFSEYIGLDTMMAIVCKTLKGVKALETYDKEGRINKSTGLHMLGPSIGRHMDGRYVVIWLEELRPYVGDFVANDPQRRLALLKPRLPTGECPHGFLGFAVNMFDLERASAVSGFFATVWSLPFDYVKTQIQKMQPDATGKYQYKCSLDFAMKTLKAGGPFNFYTGFPIYCIRIAAHVMFIEEAERSLHDAIMIIRRALKNFTVVVGGGAIDVINLS